MFPITAESVIQCRTYSGSPPIEGYASLFPRCFFLKFIYLLIDRLPSRSKLKFRVNLSKIFLK